MQTATLTTSDGSLLRGIRATLDEADAALLCVAFVHERGLHLIGDELEARRKRRAPTRLLATTTFDARAGAALTMARSLGVEVRVLNPGSGTYHPKLYLGRAEGSASAVIGSGNLTAGLVANLEAGVRLQGSEDDEPLQKAWAWGEQLWSHARAQDWDILVAADEQEEVFAPDLYLMLQAEVRRDPVFLTLGPNPAPNRVEELTPVEAIVATRKTAAAGQRGAPIPAWMFNLAWSFLKLHGSLTNQQLLNELRVHRSSAVCAILARLAPVSASAGPGITLRWR